MLFTDPRNFKSFDNIPIKTASSLLLPSPCKSMILFKTGIFSPHFERARSLSITRYHNSFQPHEIDVINKLTSCVASSNSIAEDTVDCIEQHNFSREVERVENVVHIGPKHGAHLDSHIHPYSFFSLLYSTEYLTKSLL